MIRPEVIPVSPVRGEPQVRGAYGFWWNTGSPENTVSKIAVVRVEIEFEDLRRSVLYLTPSTWYGSARRITRAWFLSSSVGDIALEVGEEPNDRVSPPPPLAEEAAFEEDWRVLPLDGADHVFTFDRPLWARAAAILMRSGRLSPTIPVLKIFARHGDLQQLDGLASWSQNVPRTDGEGEHAVFTILLAGIDFARADGGLATLGGTFADLDARAHMPVVPGKGFRVEWSQTGTVATDGTIIALGMRWFR